MVEQLVEAWKEEKIPVLQGIVTSAGLYYKIENTESQFIVSKPIPFSFDFSGMYFSAVYSTFTMDFDKYILYCGEGSWGSDGFVYIENKNTKDLVWCFIGDFNPIIKCTLSDSVLVAENNNGCKYIFEFQNPERAYRECAK